MLCLRQKYSVTVYNKMSYREKTPIGYGVNAPVVKLADTIDYQKIYFSYIYNRLNMRNIYGMRLWMW